MSRICFTISLGLAFAVSLVLKWVGGAESSLSAWDKAMYAVAGGMGALLILKFFARTPMQPEPVRQASQMQRRDGASPLPK